MVSYKSYIEREIIAFYWLSLISITVFLLGRLGKILGSWNKGRQLPGPPCSSFYGHGRIFSGACLSDVLCKFHKQYGGVVKLWLSPTQLMVSVADTELIKEVLSEAEDKLPLSGRAFRLAFGKSSLFISSFDKVKHQRKSLEVKLGNALLERASVLPREMLDCIIERAQSTTKEGIECEMLSQHLAFTVLGVTIFGDIFLAWPKATVYEELLMNIAKDACFWASYGVSPFWKREFRKFQDSCITLKCLTKELMKECEQACNSKFLWGSDGEMGYEQCGEIISLMFHGSLSMAALIANILTRLTTHLDIQDKIRLEIISSQKVKSRNQLNMDVMPNLLAAVYESLRLLPAGPLLQRCSLQHDLCLKNGMVIPAAAIIVVPIQLVQMDSLKWGNDAGKFNPCRFLSRNDGERESLTEPKGSEAFFPFGSGARVCIGQRLAILGISSLLAALLEIYEVRNQPGIEGKPKPGMSNCVLQLLPSPKIVFVRRVKETKEP